MRFFLVALWLSGAGLVACGMQLPCSAGHVCETPGARCSYIEGADPRSMIPQRYVCECEGQIHPVPANFSQPACGLVRTWCDGRVLAYREVRSFAPQPSLSPSGRP